ncbi:5'-3' exoribonuclease 2-like [Diceros bicornis minor]|uniref:5'-3' exoribonuclease 2-like n=1 Tax=Diceros bicornis minor TaxID=77932 RepID=UPI0026EFF229|nr:5'-3' exoribonuclease 2-like [Diceros bicornis minor]
MFVWTNGSCNLGDPNSWAAWCAFVSPGVAPLPFVDERRLRAALEEVYPDLTPEETRRNSLGGDVLFVGKHHPLHDFVLELYQTGSTEPVGVPPELCHGIQGKFSLDEEAILPDQIVCSPVPMLRDLTQNAAIR